VEERLATRTALDAKQAEAAADLFQVSFRASEAFQDFRPAVVHGFIVHARESSDVAPSVCRPKRMEPQSVSAGNFSLYLARSRALVPLTLRVPPDILAPEDEHL
jgi:hypothetical protein